MIYITLNLKSSGQIGMKKVNRSVINVMKISLLCVAIAITNYLEIGYIAQNIAMIMCTVRIAITRDILTAMFVMRR